MHLSKLDQNLEMILFLQIPLLPYNLINILHAPTPYIIGLHDSQHLDDDIFEELDEVRYLPYSGLQ